MGSRDLSVSIALAAVSTTVAASFAVALRGDRWIVPLVAAALLPHLVSATARALRRSTPVVDVGVSLLVLVIAAAVLVGPAPGAVADALRTGLDALGHDAPVVARDGVILMSAGAVWGVATIADQVAFHHDGTVGAIVPGVAVMIVVSANFGSTEEVWPPVSAFAVAAIVFLTLQHRRLLERQRTWIGSPPSRGDALRFAGGGAVMGLLVVALGVGGAVALTDNGRSLVDFSSIPFVTRGDAPSSYNTEVAPLLNVGDELRQPEITSLFTVRAERPAYWRLLALDHYSSRDGGQWTLEAGDDEVSDSLDAAVPRDALSQRFEIGPSMVERWIPAAFEAVDVSASADLGLVVPSSATLVTDRPTIADATYTVRSQLPRDATQINRAAAQAGVPDDVVQFTQLPDDVPPVIAETAQSVAGALDDPVAQAEALRDFFRDPSFVYDPDVVLGDDAAAIDTFMRERRGFCVQFATAYALMARSLGIPARIGVGYVPGTLDEGTGRYVVTNQDAHAWPELYFTGAGWTMPFDPTPPADGTSPGGSALPGEVQPQPTPVTTPQTATPAPTTPQTAAPAPSGSTPDGSTPSQASDDGSGSVSIDTQQSDSSGPLVLLLALVAALVVLLLLPVAGVLAWKHRRRARRRSDPDRAVAIAGAWNEALDTLAEHRIAASESHTPLQTASQVTHRTTEAMWTPMSSLATAYNEARYGAATPSEDQVEAAWHDVDSMRGALDASLGPVARVRTRLSLRGLRRRREERASEPV